MSMDDNLTVQAMKTASKSMWQSQAEVNVNVGNGAMMASLSGANIDVTKGCGNSDMTLFSMGTLNVNTGLCGEDTINAVSIGDANIFTHGSDDHVELQTTGAFNVDVGNGSEPDNDFLKVIGVLDGSKSNTASLGNGDDKAIIVASNVQVNKGTGSMTLGSLGNDITINTEASTNNIGAYGNNIKVNLLAGQSADDIRSLDYWMEDGVSTDTYAAQTIMKDDNSGSFALKDVVQILDKDGETKISLSEYDSKYNSETVAFFKEQLGELFNSATAVSGGTYTTDPTQTETYETVDLEPETDGGTFDVDAIITKYKLNDTQAAALRSVDLSEKLSDGSPKYALINSLRYNGYVLVENNTGHKDAKVVSDGATLQSKYSSNTSYSVYSSESGDSRTTTTTGHEQYKVTTESTTTYTDAHIVGGLSNWSINGSTSNNGSSNIIASVSTGEFTVNKGTDLSGEYTNKNIFNYIGGHINSTNISTTSNIISRTLVDSWTTTSISEGGLFNLGIGSIVSPLVLDMNGDGVVSAASGMGVDVNNDGKADGAATNGDKMLAMSDMNGNSKIDGAEVFGDQTVSPFTGEKLNAANGFEALEMIAKEAEKYTGISCMDGSNVDVQKLAEALATKGIKLGFISDNNVTELEDLAGVKTINTDDYEEVDASGDVQHRQLGSFTTENGETRKVDDVWFKL